MKSIVVVQYYKEDCLICTSDKIEIKNTIIAENYTRFFQLLNLKFFVSRYYYYYLIHYNTSLTIDNNNTTEFS